MVKRCLLVITAATLLVSLREASAETPAKRLNVLFIAVDDLRPELGCYGNAVVKTPNIDRLAARGVLFEHAYCQQAVCSPTRSSLMTSRRPDATRVWDLETHFRVALPDAITLPQHFKANGYYCSALSKIYHHGFEDGRSWNEPHWYPSGQTIDTDPVDWTKRIVKNVGAGVREYSAAAMPKDNDKPLAGARAGQRPRGDAFEVSPKSDDELPDGYTAAEAVRRLSQLKQRKEPFFFAVGFLKPHLPFVAPKKCWDLYDPDKIPGSPTDRLPDGAPIYAGHDNGELHAYANVPRGNPIPKDFAKKLRHGYYACVSYLDAQVGKLLDALDREGLSDNTVVVLWGDHGWQLGEHGLWHKHTNFEIATRVPLLISVPGMKGRCAAPVEFLDVYPTLADVCGLPIPDGLDGVSLKPQLENPSLPSRKPAISQFPRAGAQTGNRNLMGYSVRNEQFRLTLWRDRKTGETVATELYDEVKDGNETVNLAGRAEQRDTVEAMTKLLPAKTAPVPDTAGRPNPAGKQAARKQSPQDRAAMFAKRDTNQDGKLTREEFMANQPDPEQAAQRWTNFDIDKNGELSREEFITLGGKAGPRQ